MSAGRIPRGGATPVSPAQATRFRQATTDARTAALAVLSPSNRARLDAALDAAASGRITVYGAVSSMISSLSDGEAAALLRVNDAMVQPFNDRATASASPDARTDAAHFLVGVGFSPEQLGALRRLERARA